MPAAQPSQSRIDMAVDRFKADFPGVHYELETWPDGRLTVRPAKETARMELVSPTLMNGSGVTDWSDAPSFK